MRKSQKKSFANRKYQTFLNNKRTIQLPSNLLSIRYDTINTIQSKDITLSLDKSEKSEKKIKRTESQSKNRRNLRKLNLENKREQRIMVGDSLQNNQQKTALYKKLSNIRGKSQQLKSMSFSKMLSRMIITQQQTEMIQMIPNVMPYDIQQRMRNTSYLRVLEQKQLELNVNQDNKRPETRSLDLQRTQRPSRQLFRRYFSPGGQNAQNLLSTKVSPDGNLIFKDQKIQSKRIHNFYISNKFKKGCERYLTKTLDNFRVG